MLSLLNHYPNIRSLGITGNGKGTGQVIGKALDELRNDPNLAKSAEITPSRPKSAFKSCEEITDS
jgi:hypothetical protein